MKNEEVPHSISQAVFVDEKLIYIYPFELCTKVLKNFTLKIF
jgi:hypothetical protein